MRFHTLACLAAAVLISSCDRTPSSSNSGGNVASCSTRAYDTIGGPFNLIDQSGKPVTQDDYKGHETLVYFGFTNCPDVCPMAMQTVGAAMDLLPEGFDEPLTMLISVDPEQDSPEVMAAYIESNRFPSKIVGLTGTSENVKAASDVFRAYYKRIDAPDSAAGYTMDHTSILYLMDKDWKLKTFFTSEATPQNIASCLQDLAD